MVGPHPFVNLNGIAAFGEKRIPRFQRFCGGSGCSRISIIPCRSVSFWSGPMLQFVPGYEAIVWNGLVAPKNTPADIIDRLHKEINAGLSDPKMMTRFAEVGSVPKSMTIVDFGKFIVEDTDKWRTVIRAANITVDCCPLAGRYSIIFH